VLFFFFCVVVVAVFHELVGIGVEKAELNQVLNGFVPIQTLKPVLVCQNAIIILDYLIKMYLGNNIIQHLYSELLFVYQEIVKMNTMYLNFKLSVPHYFIQNS
jgi:hypothetical protein